MNLYKLYTGTDELLYENQQHTNPIIVWENIMAGRRKGYLGDIQQEARDGRYKDVLKKDARVATLFARDILHGRFLEAEEQIATSARWSYIYASTVLEGRFELGEKAIATNARFAFSYAAHILKERFWMAEDTIKQDPKLWATYIEKFE